MWMLWWRTLQESMSTRRASAKARKVHRPSRLTVVMRANTVAHEPVASMRYPEKYTIRTPVQNHTHTHNKKHISTKIQAKHGAIFYVIVQFFFSRREKCHSPLQIPHWTANCHPPLPVLFIWRKTSLRSLDEIYMAHRCRRNWRETQQLKV